MHGRFHGTFRVALPVRPGFHDSCSSWQVQLRHLSLAFSKFAEGYLPHEAVVPELPQALVVVVSTSLSLDRAQEHFVNTRLGLDRSVLEILGVGVCCIPNSSQRTYFSKNPAQTSATRKRSIDVGRNESTCSTTTQRSQKSDIIRSCIS